MCDPQKVPLDSETHILYVLGASAVPPLTHKSQQLWMLAAAEARRRKIYIPLHLNYPGLALTPVMSISEKSVAMYFYMHPAVDRAGRSEEETALEMVCGLRCYIPYPLACVANAASEHLETLACTPHEKARYCKLLFFFLKHLERLGLRVDWTDAVPMCHDLDLDDGSQNTITSLVFYRLLPEHHMAAICQVLSRVPGSLQLVCATFKERMESTPSFKNELRLLSETRLKTLTQACQTYVEKHGFAECSTCASRKLLRRYNSQAVDKLDPEIECDCKFTTDSDPLIEFTLWTCSRLFADAHDILYSM